MQALFAWLHSISRRYHWRIESTLPRFVYKNLVGIILRYAGIRLRFDGIRSAGYSRKMIDSKKDGQLSAYKDVLEYMLTHDCKIEQESIKAVELVERKA